MGKKFDSGVTYDQFHELADYLRGSCKTIQEGIEACGLDEGKIDIDELSSELIHDGEIELCSDCGWWCETSEMRSDGVCVDCGGEDEEE